MKKKIQICLIGLEESIKYIDNDPIFLKMINNAIGLLKAELKSTGSVDGLIKYIKDLEKKALKEKASKKK